MGRIRKRNDELPGYAAEPTIAPPNLQPFESTAPDAESAHAAPVNNKAAIAIPLAGIDAIQERVVAL